VTEKQTAQVSGGFDDNFVKPDVDESLIEKKRMSFASAIWLAKWGGTDKNETKKWVIDREDLSQMPDLPGFWTEEKIRFGGDPNTPETPVYSAEGLRCVAIEERERQIVTVGEGPRRKEHYYHIFTPADMRVAGKLSFHYQVLVSLTGLPYDELIVLGLRGMNRTLSWKNDRSRYDNYPLGVKNKVEKYISETPKGYNEMPLFCSWIMDLRGVFKDGKPFYIPVGPNKETYVQPFTVDMRTGIEGTPDIRYVGNEMYDKLEDLRRDVGKPWRKQWTDLAKGENVDANETESINNNDQPKPTYSGAPPIGTQEDDEIPF